MIPILASALPLFFGMPHGTELIVVLIIILIFYGPKQLPKIGRALGGGIKEFKDGLKTGLPEDEEGKEPQRPEPRTTTTVEALPPQENRSPETRSANQPEESHQTREP